MKHQYELSVVTNAIGNNASPVSKYSPFEYYTECFIPTKWSFNIGCRGIKDFCFTFSKFIGIQFIYNKMNIFYVYSLMNLDKSIQLCDYNHNQYTIEHFHHLPNFPISLSKSTHISSTRFLSITAENICPFWGLM